MAAYLGIGVEEFRRLYTRAPEVAAHGAAGDLWLRDQPGPERACVFLEPDNSCRVHPVKPQRCRDFPLKWRTADVMEYCVGLRGER
jgi:Fe-S-cluster containining protein